MNKKAFIEELAALRTSSTFLNLHRYKNEFGEVADFNIVFHISYENALKRSVAVLESTVPDSPLASQARHELLQSFHTSIANIAKIPIEEIDDAYTRFFDDDGNYIKGVKMHTSTGTLHIYGFAHQKVILVPGVYPKTNRRPLTIEKDKLRDLCPVSKFRQFRMLPNQVEKIKVQHISLLPPG